MKSLCCVLCGILLMSGVLVHAGAAESEVSMGKDEKAIWIVDDFEDGDLDGWATPTGPCTVSNDALGASGTSRSVKIDGACGHFSGSWFDMGGMVVTGLSYWVRSGDVGSHDAYLVLDDADSLDDSYVLLLALSNSGEFVVNNGISAYSLGPYVANTWYSVSIEIDWVGRTFDLSIDGETLGWNMAFADPTIEGVNRLHLYNLNSGPGWWDQIMASTPPVSTEILVDGFESADDTGWNVSTPAIPPRLVVYSAGGVAGAIGGRLGADRLCGAAARGKVGLPLHSKTRAFISVDNGDAIWDAPDFGVPTDRTVTGPGTVKIADNWADLMDGSIDQTLAGAGVQTAGFFWYSGSNADGSITAATCSGWTDGSAILDGTYGKTVETTSAWLSTGNATCGVELYEILCLAWR